MKGGDSSNALKYFLGNGRCRRECLNLLDGIFDDHLVNNRQCLSQHSPSTYFDGQIERDDNQRGYRQEHQGELPSGDESEEQSTDHSREQGDEIRHLIAMKEGRTERSNDALDRERT